jgi:putative membrane protein
MADDALIRTWHTGPAVLLGVVVSLQIAYPLTHGDARRTLTAFIVVGLAATCVLHAALTRGLRTAGMLLLLTALPGWAVEAIGVHTGFPFGSYDYAADLGPQWLRAPLLIGPAWTMLAWPAALVARRLVRGRVARVLVGAWALAVTDLFLDPQQVAAGYWTWQFPSPHLPGVADVPLTNYAGWLLVALVFSIVVQALAGDGDDTVMVAAYLWLYVGWIVALAGFLDLGAAAAWGALGMGTVAVPLAARLWQARPSGGRPGEAREVR